MYFKEWEYCRIIPLSADRGISVGALISGGTTLSINRFNDSFSSHMHKCLLFGMNYVHEACNSTIRNLCNKFKKLNCSRKSIIYA